VQVRFNPNFSNGATNAAWAMGQLKGAGLTVLPSIADGSGKGRMAATLADPGLRGAHVADIVNTVVSNGYDGIDLDYETFAFTDGSASWAATQPNWTIFVAELGAALHAQGKLLAVTIPPPCSTGGACGLQTGYWVYNIAGIAPSVDRIRIMAYDYHVGAIGPIAPMPWVRAIVAYSASVMDPAKLQIGVPTYGRAWTRKTASGGFQLSGNCPSSGTSAYRSLTSSASVSDRDIPALLASVGVAPTDVQWSDADQENWVYYDKSVNWTDASGASQTCTAKRVLWFVGPQAVLARTQLVGEFGLNAAAYWTVGGEDPAQWPLITGYAQSLAPAPTNVTAAGVPNAVFGTTVAVTANVTSGGAPLVGAAATLQFRPAGQAAWVDIQTAAVGADGNVAFQVVPPTTGDWQVFVPGAQGRVEGVSSPFTTQILSLVTATPTQTRIPKGGRIVVRVAAQPAIAGQSVSLQIKTGDTWKNVGGAKTNAKGRVRVKATVPKAKGRYTYRVVAVGKKPILTGASAEFPIRVTK
jgi:spore germination protein YaaH